MTLKEKIHAALSATDEGKAFLAYVASGRNKMRCYENAPRLRELLNQQGIETILVGAHYPDIHGNCSNFYLLCRDDNEVLLVDPTVNTELKTQELFAEDMESVKITVNSIPSINWPTNWNLQNIVVHAPDPKNISNRDAFKKRWGKFAEGIIFKDEIKEPTKTSPSMTDGSRLGEPVTADDLRWRFGKAIPMIPFSPEGWKR